MPVPPSPLHQPAPHESGYRHTSGEARYVDDLPTLAGTLVCTIFTSEIARGKLVNLDVAAARACPGIAAVLTAAEIPGSNRIGPIFHDEPLLARDQVDYVGQPLALVVGESPEACRAAAATIQAKYEEHKAILSIEQAIEANSFHGEPHTIARGDVVSALAAAKHVLEGTFRSGAQDHFYLETQAALAVPLEDGNLHVYSSTQHPTEIQHMVAKTLGIGQQRVVCEVPRMGGGFGGKESQATGVAVLAAVAATLTKRPVKVWLNREQDMLITGKRHPFFTRYRAGFDTDGKLLALDIEISSDGGFSSDLSLPVLDRALFHLDNSYYIPNLRFVGRVCQTNFASNTAFRGFGGPQGMLATEMVIDRLCEQLGRDPAEVRVRNFYGDPPNNRTPYGQEVRDCRLQRIAEELLTTSEYNNRRTAIEAFNRTSTWRKRGIGFAPVKFGISFTKSVLNQAGALVLVYADGSLQLNHGGTEMGQGLHTKMLAVCCHELGVRPEQVRVMQTATDKVPNTSATAASSGSDLNGQAVRQACATIRERLRKVAAGMLECDDLEVVFAQGTVRASNGRSASFAEVTAQAYLEQVSLSATGYYRTPGIHYDHTTGQGEPFYYFAYGASVCEIEVDGATGEHRLVRVDILHDVGSSLVPTIDVGQVEGGFVQGVGWLTCEQMIHDSNGRPLTLGPSTYKIPAIGDVPTDMRVKLLERAAQPGVIHGSKAVGEPPLMLAIGVVHALRHAIYGFGKRVVELKIPATPEAILRAVEHQRTGVYPS